MKTGISDHVLKILLINCCLFLFMIGTAMAGIVADAGRDAAYEPNSVVVLDGSKSSDSDDQELTYSWYMAKKPVGSIATLENFDS